MRFLSTGELSGLLRFAADPEKQIEDGRITLTLLEVQQIMGEARLDFEDRESEDARRIKRPARSTAGEESGWWDLGQGVYWVTLRERVEIPQGCAFFLQPHSRILRNGLWHPTVLIRDWDQEMDGIMLSVLSRSVRIRENSPVSSGMILHPGSDRG